MLSRGSERYEPRRAGQNRTLFPASLDDYATEDNPMRAVDVFVDGLDLGRLGFIGAPRLSFQQ
jgi:hypothetical protein